MERDLDTEIVRTNWNLGDALEHRNTMTEWLSQARKRAEQIGILEAWVEDARRRVATLHKQKQRLIARRDAA